jgi:hypothetical protein
MNMPPLIQIIQYLQSHKQTFVQWNDEPFMKFAAEWQDWSFARKGFSVLALGYWYVHEDDLVPDPNLVLELQDGQIQEMRLSNPMGTFACDGAFAADFIALVWGRHFVMRLTQLHGIDQ